MAEEVKFEDVIDHVLENEGGFVNDPDDRGGMTFMGISRRWFPDEPVWVRVDEILAVGGNPDEWVNDPPIQHSVKEFYRREFWEKCFCDRLPNSIRTRHFDFSVNGGMRSSTRILQQLANIFCGLGIDEDGLVGPATRTAVGEIAVLDEGIQEVLDIAYRSLQGVHFLNICKGDPSQLKFIRGWLLQRVN